MTDPVYPDFRDKSLLQLQDNTDWEIFAQAKGDLNEDSIDDMAIILQSKQSFLEKRCEDCEAKNHKVRIMLVMLSKANALKVVAQNNVFIARADEGGITTDMKPEISIVNGQISLAYLLIRGETNYTFENEKDEIVLVKATKLSTSHYIFRSDVIDFNERVLVTESRSDKDGPTQKKTTKVTMDKLPRLSELKMMGSWNVEGVFL
jgi:hypothetical protein